MMALRCLMSQTSLRGKNMQQIFDRGQELKNHSRIRKMICSGDEWQIYMTNNQSYVLAATKELFNQWNAVSAFPDGFFEPAEENSATVYHVSSADNLIASLENGPFPNSALQVLKFSAAFKEAMKTYGITKLQNAIYLEENALLLPVPSTRNEIVDAGTLYASWLTAGVNISIDQGDRVAALMSWMPSDALTKSMTLAGFQGEERRKAKANSRVKEKTKSPSEAKEGNIPSEPFELLGRPELEEFFNDNIVDIVRNQEKYERMGISFPGATILYGPPGCGKTYAVDKLAEYLGWPRFDIDSSSVASPFIHDTSKKISEVFQKAISAAPSILVIDEMEAFLSDRASAGASGTHHVEEVAEFLRQIPEAVSSGVLIFAMTNLIDSIDPAILRRGRFDHIIEVRMASTEEIESLLLKRFEELPIDPSVDARRIAKKLDGRPLSDVSFILREAGRFAVKKDQSVIDNECIDSALEMLPDKKEKNKPRIGFQ